MVVGTNVERLQGLYEIEKKILKENNRQKQFNFKDWRHQGILLIRANLLHKSTKQPLKASQETWMRDCISAQKDVGIMGNLYCILGECYIITKNIDVSSGIANGTLCELIDVVFHDDSETMIVNDRNNDPVHSVFAKQVKALIFKHVLHGYDNSCYYDPLPKGCFPLLSESTSTTLHLNQKISLNIVQFPCLPAKILTGHRVQGQSRSGLILGGLRPQHQYGQDGWLYVVLSRVRTLKGLHTFVKLPTDPKKYKPRSDVDEEMNRLRNIYENKTKSKVYQLYEGLLIDNRTN